MRLVLEPGLYLVYNEKDFLKGLGQLDYVFFPGVIIQPLNSPGISKFIWNHFAAQFSRLDCEISGWYANSNIKVLISSY